MKIDDEAPVPEVQPVFNVDQVGDPVAPLEGHDPGTFAPESPEDGAPTPEGPQWGPLTEVGPAPSAQVSPTTGPSASQPVPAELQGKIDEGIRDANATHAARQDRREISRRVFEGAGQGKGGNVSPEAFQLGVIDRAADPSAARVPDAAVGTNQQPKGGTFQPESPPDDGDAQDSWKRLDRAAAWQAAQQMKAAVVAWPIWAQIAAALAALAVVGVVASTVVAPSGTTRPGAPAPAGATPAAVPAAAPTALIDLQGTLRTTAPPTPRPSPTISAVGATIEVRPVYTFPHTDTCPNSFGAQESFLPSPIPVAPGRTVDPARTPGVGARVFVQRLDPKTVVNPPPGQTLRYDWGVSTYRRGCNWSLSLEYQEIRDAGRSLLLFYPSTTYRFEQTVPTCTGSRTAGGVCEIATVILVTNAAP